MTKTYDLIIIGGGPAGLTAGLYASRARLATLLLEKSMLGGEVVNAEIVENFPGFPEGISGFDLGQLMHRQATRFGLETISTQATGIELKGQNKVVHTPQGDFLVRALILACGSERQKLGVPGEEKLTGRGVSYCATCDGALFQDRVVAVVGGGDAALSEALFLTRFASKVVVIHRRRQLRAARILQERAFAEPKMQFLWDTVVKKIEGDKLVNNLELLQLKTGEKSALEVQGLFISVGFQPNTQFLGGLLKLDAGGHIVTNELMATEIAGIFAAGDVRRNSARQAITAAGDGATAALSAERFLAETRL